MGNKKSDKTSEELSTVMTEALFKLQALVEHDPSKSHDFLSIARTFLTGIITTTADLLEVTQPGSGPLIYADIEALAKNGRFLCIADVAKNNGSARYSISDIGPNDMESGMNYVDQKLSETLSASIHELPMPLRTLEMFLRPIETLLANLLNQKFNTPNDPHKILDSLCEHVHMGLDDLNKRNNNVIPIRKQKSDVNEKSSMIEIPQPKKLKQQNNDRENLENFLDLLTDKLQDLERLDLPDLLSKLNLDDVDFFPKTDKKAVKQFESIPAQTIEIPTDLKKTHQHYVKSRESLNIFLNVLHDELMENIDEASEELSYINFDGTTMISNDSELNIVLDYMALYHKENDLSFVNAWLKQNNTDAYDQKIIEAFRNARFSVLRLDEYLPHSAIKVVDLISEQTYILMDSALNKEKKKGLIFLCSTMDLKDFIMSAGAGIPIDIKSKGGKSVLTLLNEHIKDLRKSKNVLTDAVEDAVVDLYGFCLQYGAMGEQTVNTVY